MDSPSVWTVAIASDGSGTDACTVDTASLSATSSTTLYASIPFPHGAQFTRISFSVKAGQLQSDDRPFVGLVFGAPMRLTIGQAVAVCATVASG